MFAPSQQALADKSLVGDDRVLDVQAVSKRFTAGKRSVAALDQVSLQAQRGRIVGLIGPDGAGKTTFMRMAAGLLTLDAGKILVRGVDVTPDTRSAQSMIGYMPQRFGLYEDLTVAENLDLYSDLHAVALSQRPQRYDRLMQMTGLERFRSRLAGKLSGGMKQKLGLACTLVKPPRLLLLDEPTVGVDPVSRRELWRIINQLVHEEQTAVLISTAYLDEAERCNHVVILDQGRVLEQGAPDMFRQRMQDRTFLISAPGMPARQLQQRLANHSQLVDAVVQSGQVRVVTVNANGFDLDKPPLGVEGATIQPADPRFEDAFVDMLRRRSRSALQTQPQGLQAEVKQAEPSDLSNRKSGCDIRVHDVKRRFGDFYAVKGVSFDVACGEVFGLLGANGAGKTTMFRMLCGLLPASAGHLFVAGVDVRRAAASARARIGYMSQHFSLYANLSVAQNLRFYASAYGLRGRRRNHRIGWALEQFELHDSINAPSGKLPLGYKQRLAMACALMHEPQILFLDEPTSGVDPLARREFWNRINALATAGVTVMVTTHFMEEADYCDRLAVMADGQILALGTPAEIKDHSVGPKTERPTMEEAFISLIENREKATVELS